MLVKCRKLLEMDIQTLMHYIIEWSSISVNNKFIKH